ncbi:MAG: mannose-1-phosphate guanyltransferase [Endomicrobia bacterium]|nr:mannose-1-phosphate guanyltransferase [Endomicrobiia bacterium]MDW8055420.1 mannose-1-phosphate guanyltransferase [Elusimicrobiota bacterium]
MQAVIMAGGFGTRLRPLTTIIPKPMVPVANKPMMEHVVRLLKKHKIEDLIVLLFYQHDYITQYFGNGEKFGVRIKYLLPEGDYGTCGAVGFAREYVKEEDFLVISADIITDFDLTQLIDFHKNKNSLATIALTSVENPLSYGIVIYDENYRIKKFLEKPTWSEVFSDKVNTGIYMLNRKVFDYIPEKTFYDFSKDLFPKFLKENLPLYACVLDGYWKDVGTLQEYRFCHYDVLEKKVEVYIEGRVIRCGNNDITVGDNTTIGENFSCDKFVIIGKNTKIGDNVTINRSIIGDNCVIEDNAVVFSSVIMNNVYVGRNCSIKESVIGHKTKLGNNVVVEVNNVIGEECELQNNAHIKANLKIWPRKIVEEGATVSTSLIWQEKWSRMLFGSTGVTGLLNSEISPEFACKLGAAFGSLLGKGKNVITSRDAHKASRMIKRSMISGLLSAGVKVGDLRAAPIPVVRYEVAKDDVDGGLHVRLSPKDPKVIEIRFFDKEGNDISVAQEKSIEQLFLREDFPRADLEEVGEIVIPPRAYEYYRDGYLKSLDLDLIRKAKLKVVIDYSYSTAVNIFPSILGELGVEVVSLNAFVDSSKIVRSEEKLKYALDQLANIVTTLDADAGFMLDNSAERIFIVDDKGKILDNQLSSMIVLLLRLSNLKDERCKIAVPVYMSNVINEVVKISHREVEVIWSKTLPRYLREIARQPDVKFVADGIGGYIFPEFQPAFDGMFAIGKILELLAKQETKISRIKREIPDFNVIHTRVPCSWEKKGFVIRRLIEEHKECRMDLIDGVKLWVSNKDWILFLPDPDEAFIHIYIETQKEKDSYKLLSEFSSMLNSWIKS